MKLFFLIQTVVFEGISEKNLFSSSSKTASNTQRSEN